MFIYIYLSIYIFKSGKIKLKYSFTSEFHAKAIISHIRSSLTYLYITYIYIYNYVGEK